MKDGAAFLSRATCISHARAPSKSHRDVGQVFPAKGKKGSKKDARISCTSSRNSLRSPRAFPSRTRINPSRRISRNRWIPRGFTLGFEIKIYGYKWHPRYRKRSDGVIMGRGRRGDANFDAPCRFTARLSRTGSHLIFRCESSRWPVSISNPPSPFPLKSPQPSVADGSPSYPAAESHGRISGEK